MSTVSKRVTGTVDTVDLFPCLPPSSDPPPPLKQSISSLHTYVLEQGTEGTRRAARMAIFGEGPVVLVLRAWLKEASDSWKGIEVTSGLTD